MHLYETGCLLQANSFLESTAWLICPLKHCKRWWVKFFNWFFFFSRISNGGVSISKKPLHWLENPCHVSFAWWMRCSHFMPFTAARTATASKWRELTSHCTLLNLMFIVTQPQNRNRFCNRVWTDKQNWKQKQTVECATKTNNTASEETQEKQVVKLFLTGRTHHSRLNGRFL